MRREGGVKGKEEGKDKDRGGWSGGRVGRSLVFCC